MGQLAHPLIIYGQLARPLIIYGQLAHPLIIYGQLAHPLIIYGQLADPLIIYGQLADPLIIYGQLADPLIIYGQLAHPLIIYGQLAHPLIIYGQLAHPLIIYGQLAHPLIIYGAVGPPTYFFVPPPLKMLHPFSVCLGDVRKISQFPFQEDGWKPNEASSRLTVGILGPTWQITSRAATQSTTPIHAYTLSVTSVSVNFTLSQQRCRRKLYRKTFSNYVDLCAGSGRSTMGQP